MVLGKIGRTLRHEGLPGLWMRLRHPKRSGGAAALTPQQQLPLQLDCPGDDLARALADALDRILGQHWQGAGEAATMLRIDPPPTRAPGQAQTALAFTQPGSVRAWLTGTDPAAARQYGAVLVPDPASLTLLRQAGLAQGRLFLCPALGQPPGPALAGDLARWLAAAGLAEPSHFSPDLFPALTGLRPRDRLCLSLPESLDRRAGFQTQSLPGFRIVDGLRLQPGWQGAGHSHATIARAALTCDAAPIWVCEDDMRPAPGFEAHLAAVEAYLDGRDWDMFSGLLTHTPPDCRIRHVERRGALTFVHLDYATGMVLNLYNRRALERLAAWTPAQGQSETDTVDAWLSRLPGLRAVTTLPFLARHDDAAMSTVFGFANRRYASLIRASESRLTRMAAEWLKRPLACDKRPPPHCEGRR